MEPGALRFLMSSPADYRQTGYNVLRGGAQRHLVLRWVGMATVFAVHLYRLVRRARSRLSSPH